MIEGMVGVGESWLKILVKYENDRQIYFKVEFEVVKEIHIFIVD